MGQPLAGLRVLDVGTRIAAPFCAGLLGEQGAEVIKVEQPGVGDFMRAIGPFDRENPDYSLFWAVEGRGRKSVTMDLHRPEGQDLFRRLAATADVVVENFRPGTMERWSIGPASCSPRLVWVRISAFGQDGPKAQRPGLDRIGLAAGGLLHLTGYPDRPPVRVGVTISDYLTATFCAQAAIAALYARDCVVANVARSGAGAPADNEDASGEAGVEPSRDGVANVARSDGSGLAGVEPSGGGVANVARSGGAGAVIDAALYGASLRILEWTLVAYDRLGVVREREGNRLANAAPLDNYPTADERFVSIVAGSDANFARLCAAMGRPELVEDPRFRRLADRAAHGDTINDIVGEWTRSLPAAAVEKACVDHDVPVATALTVADLFADAHVAARDDIVTVDDPILGPIPQQAPFPRSPGAPPPTGAPRLGEHTRAVLADSLGLTPDDLDRLAVDGVI